MAADEQYSSVTGSRSKRAVHLKEYEAEKEREILLEFAWDFRVFVVR
jgi:hypothetical protein